MKTIGIIGGMGPEATCKLYEQIIKGSPASTDQEHVPVIIFSNPQIPDRTAAILGNGESPVEAIINTAKALQSAGAGILIMPCNTAHYFFNTIQDRINLPLINMIDETARYVVEKYPHITEVGLLATTGCVQSCVYDNMFSKYDLTIVKPSMIDQESLVHSAIYDGVKAGNMGLAKHKLIKAVQNLTSNRSLGAIIAGCTEVPLALQQEDIDIPLINPSEILAKSAVKRIVSEDKIDVNYDGKMDYFLKLGCD